jgi:hypothetical protein
MPEYMLKIQFAFGPAAQNGSLSRASNCVPLKTGPLPLILPQGVPSKALVSDLLLFDPANK